jgi:hypothetical protein
VETSGTRPSGAAAPAAAPRIISWATRSHSSVQSSSSWTFHAGPEALVLGPQFHQRALQGVEIPQVADDQRHRRREVTGQFRHVTWEQTPNFRVLGEQPRVENPRNLIHPTRQRRMVILDSLE